MHAPTEIMTDGTPVSTAYIYLRMSSINCWGISAAFSVREAAVSAANTLTHLKTLTIGDYYAPDLTALTGLAGLEVLNLHKGSLERLEGLQALKRLRTLSVGFHPVTDLSPLSGLEQVNYIQLEGLAVTDFSVLAGLPALGTVVVPADQGPLVEASCPNYAFALRTY